MSPATARSAPTHLRVAVCQINTTVGDLDGNVALALDALAEAGEAGADVAVMPEMTITGYPPEDLLLKPGFVADCRAALEKFAAQTGRCAVVIGFADGDDEPGRSVQDVAGVTHFNGVWNAVAICAEGRVFGTYHKRHLPNYDVFDELRHFRPGDEALALFDLAGVPVGVTLCEDSWIPDGPVSQLARGGARLVLNINGSPFREGKQAVREQVITDRVLEAGVPVVYANLVGAQDELIFDGGSFVVAEDRDGAHVVARCNSFVEGVDVFDIELPPARTTMDTYHVVPVTPPHATLRPLIPAPMVPRLDPLAERWEALVLATRDYVHKAGFEKVCLGISGGVDSSLTAAIAVDALGPDNVHGILLPSRHSSDHSLADAAALAANLGIATTTVPIEPAHAALTEMLVGHVSDGAIEVGDLTDQNLQARIRGVVWMAMANEHGWLALTAGNKSEAAVGYSTLYGDTAGAFAVIKDVWKLMVYELGRWRNQVAIAETGAPVIPESVLTKAPSAELRPGQTDDQSLPPYEVLDPILRAYVEDDRTVTEIVAMQLADREVVERVCRLVDMAEFKRRQTPLGARLTKKAFGRDRRMPIINRYRG
ncbi:MAG: NAD+ synthase [Acidimicrobiales bacterium]